ncbi:uncharacterized protein G2W53_040152 [Senna tora]|uniref:Uncharacterized protein n=1 Tax=Senna tora TaxID=362788 RepID=A0A834SR38_9FABA|nr:uncharacterized protein G2W53_040152 [Senna tora]
MDKKTIKRNLIECSSFANPIFHGSTKDAWFDSVAIFDSDCDDD